MWDRTKKKKKNYQPGTTIVITRNITYLLENEKILFVEKLLQQSCWQVLCFYAKKKPESPALLNNEFLFRFIVTFLIKMIISVF